MKIYVAGPLRQGDQFVNCRTAILAAERVIEMGHIPFVPHMTFIWHYLSPHDFEYWMAFDLAWLAECDALLRLPGDSEGSDIEEARARELDLLIFKDITEIPLPIEAP